MAISVNQENNYQEIRYGIVPPLEEESFKFVIPDNEILR